MNEGKKERRKEGGKEILTIRFDGTLRGHRLHVKGSNDFQRPVPNLDRPVAGPRDHFLLPHHLHARHHPTVGRHLKINQINQINQTDQTNQMKQTDQIRKKALVLTILVIAFKHKKIQTHARINATP